MLLNPSKERRLGPGCLVASPGPLVSRDTLIHLGWWHRDSVGNRAFREFLLTVVVELWCYEEAGVCVSAALAAASAPRPAPQAEEAHHLPRAPLPLQVQGV